MALQTTNKATLSLLLLLRLFHVKNAVEPYQDPGPYRQLYIGTLSEKACKKKQLNLYICKGEMEERWGGDFFFFFFLGMIRSGFSFLISKSKKTDFNS